MSIILPGYDQVRGNTRWNTDYRETNVPWRIVLHTVEGDPSSVAGMKATARNHRYGPHLWVSPRLNAKIQTVPLDKSAYALLHPSGTPETNHMRAIQVEQFGFAAQTQDWDDSWCDWIGEHVIAEICRVIPGINLDYVERTYGAGDGIILATSSSPIRHNEVVWRNCNWVTSHQRIIANDHWDCGRYKMDRALRAAREALGNPGPVAPPAPPTPNVPSEGGLTMSEVDHILNHINAHVIDRFDREFAELDEKFTRLENRVDQVGLGTLSFMMNNQKTGVLFRKAGESAPWYGMMGGRVLGPLDFESARQFKELNEITENSVEVADPLFSILTASAEVVLDDVSVDEIVEGVSETNQQFLNGLPDSSELAQTIAQQVVAQLGPERSTQDILEAIAEALQAAAAQR